MTGCWLVYAIYEDISEQKAAERELARERSLLERIVEDSPDGIASSMRRGKSFAPTPAFDRLFGLGGDPRPSPLGAPRGRGKGGRGPGSYPAIEGRKRLDFDAVRYRKDGSEIHLSIRSVAITGDGPTGEYLAVYRDITSRAMVQHQLATERTYFENLFMNSPLAIALVRGEASSSGSTIPSRGSSGTTVTSVSARTWTNS